MKEIYFLLFSVLLTINAFSQSKSNENIKVKYHIIINQGELPKASPNPQVRAGWEKTLKAIPSLEFTLNADSQAYKFSVSDNLNSDFYDYQYVKSALISLGGDRTYYKNKSIKLVNRDFWGEKFNIKIRKDYDWVITKEKKHILGFSCIKATSHFTTIDKNAEEIRIDVEAWFAPEMNIPGGPLGMDNLPGLVLEGSEDKRFSYRASKIDLDPNTTDSWKAIPEANRTIEEWEFEKIVENALNEIKARG